MPHLKFYEKERERFKAAHALKLEDEKAKSLLRDMAKRFEIDVGDIRFTCRSRAGACYWGSHAILLKRPASLHIVCHELAHLYEHQKHSNNGHNKKLMSTIGRFISYANECIERGLLKA